MRHGSLLFVVSLFVLGCATTSTPATSNAQLIRNLYDSFGRGDIPTVLASFDPNIEWREAENFKYADHNPYRGPQAIVEGVFARIPQDIDNFRMNIENVVADGDSVVVLGRYLGAGKVTGQPLNAQFAHHYKLRNGKIVSFQQYTDTAQLTRVLR